MNAVFFYSKITQISITHSLLHRLVVGVIFEELCLGKILTPQNLFAAQQTYMNLLENTERVRAITSVDNIITGTHDNRVSSSLCVNNSKSERKKIHSG